MRSEELVGPNQDKISSGNYDVPSTSSDWTDPYEKIGRCNNIIIKGALAPVPDKQKKQMVS